MAPAMNSWNKLLGSRERGETLYGKFAADKDGNPTDNPVLAQSLLPIGNYKGYGLAAMGEVLSGVLSGMAFGMAIPAMFTTPMDRPRNLGQFYLVIRTDVCQSQHDFEKRMQQMTDEVRLEPNKPGEKVMLANDPQIDEAQLRQKEGILIDDFLLKEFEKLTKELEVKPLT